MDVKLLKEHEDGSATYTFDMSDEEMYQLLNLGIITALKRGIEEGKKYDGQSSVGDTGSGTKDCIYGTCVESDKSNCNRVCGSFKVPD